MFVKNIEGIKNNQFSLSGIMKSDFYLWVSSVCFCFPLLCVELVVFVGGVVIRSFDLHINSAEIPEDSARSLKWIPLSDLFLIY